MLLDLLRSYWKRQQASIPVPRDPPVQEGFDDVVEVPQQGGGGQRTVSPWGLVIGLVTFCLAFYLSWQCHSTSSTVGRVAWALLSGLFSYVYLIYYLIVHIILQRPCVHA